MRVVNLFMRLRKIRFCDDSSFFISLQHRQGYYRRKVSLFNEIIFLNSWILRRLHEKYLSLDPSQSRKTFFYICKWMFAYQPNNSLTFSEASVFKPLIKPQHGLIRFSSKTMSFNEKLSLTPRGPINLIDIMPLRRVLRWINTPWAPQQVPLLPS